MSEDRLGDDIDEALKMASDNVFRFPKGGPDTPAIEENPRPALNRAQLVAEMNEKYCWLDDEKVIFDTQYFVTRKREQVDSDMAHLYAVEIVEGRKKVVTALGAWLTSPDRRRFAGRKFMPGAADIASKFKGKDLGGEYINLWRGWGCEPVKGTVEPFLNLVARLCDFKEEESKYLLWRLAIKVQKPWMKIPSYTLIVTSEEGTGKSQLVKFVAGLYGKHGKIITDREMESSFDDWKKDGILLAGAEEISLKEKRSAANRLKAIASMEVDNINPKGQPSYQVENFYDLIFTANHRDAVYVRTGKERRPFIVMHDPVAPMGKVERDELQAWYDSGGKEALLHHLMHEVAGNEYDPYEPAPLTAGKSEMAAASRNPAEQFVEDLMQYASEDLNICPLKSFEDILREYCGQRIPDKRDEAVLAKALNAAGSISRRFRFGGPRTRIYPIRDTAEWKGENEDKWIQRYKEHLELEREKHEKERKWDL